MLSRHDQDLVARDPALPGLATVLDPQAVAELLQQACPDHAVTGADIFYLRYKPGTSCLAAYRVDVGGREQVLAIRARRRDAFDKFAKHREKPSVAGLFGAGFGILPEALALSVYPNDRRLRALPRLADPAPRARLLAQFGFDPSSAVAMLRYRPERRFVGSLTTPAGRRAALKLYRREDFDRALGNAEAFRSDSQLRVPTVSAQSKRHGLIANRWIPGCPMPATPAAAERIGAALASLHAQGDRWLPRIHRSEQARVVLQLGEYLAILWPPLAALARDIAVTLSADLTAEAAIPAAIHGDLHLEQLIDAGDAIGMVDFDEAGIGTPAWDLGNILGHLRIRALSGEEPNPDDFGEALLQSYCRSGGKVSERQVRLHTAHSMFRLAARPFRDRQRDWPADIEQILHLARSVGGLESAKTPTPRMMDSALPRLTQALEPDAAIRHFDLAQLGPGDWRIRSVHVLRHKLGRRCVLEYRLDQANDEIALIGKIRSRGADARGFALQRALWGHGFGEGADDRIVVPEPIAVVPGLMMWLQRKVAGRPFGFEPGRPNLTPDRAAEAITKLHRSPIKTDRHHTLADELRILESRLSALADRRPRLGRRLAALAETARRLAASAAPVRPRLIHRDFYHDHLIVDGDTIAIIDFDLCCLGDPAVDVGNFSAHLTELALRTHGDPSRFAAWQQAFKNRYRQLNGAGSSNIALYELLALIRLVEIGDRMIARRPTVEPLLELSENLAAMSAANRRACHA